MKFSAFAGVAGAVVLAFATSATAQTVDAYAGDWEGVLHAGPRNLRLELHIKTSAGDTTATLDSLDQGMSAPATGVKVEDGELGVLFLPLGGELKGKISTDGKTITGSWTQGTSLPLTLTRKATAAAH
ncbi:MAG: hypothetical protein ACREE0_00605 [Phenylobacterium sp.]